MHAELQAIFHGLEKAWNHGYRHVECESDCQSLLKLIKEGVPTTHPCALVIDLIKRFIDYPWLLLFIIHCGKIIVVQT
ncbi:ribonuclease H protein, partial [Trifolium medium]|nr:ribonuclease H protein [Trifolium medium]